ncbi:MAG: heavy metal translocating P-type ATPase [Nitrospirae bacterium]|nr:heavy metal translocating P-type ATPase [Nitrospirota bacterium]
MLKCDHCLLTFPEKDAVYGEIRGQKKVFCCGGCHGIYALIYSEGLDAFYEGRKWEETGIPAIAKKEIDIKPFSELVRDTDGKKEMDIFIDGIRCASCVWLNEKYLGRTTGVEYVRINYATHKARIRWDPASAGIDTILRRILSIGYTPKIYSESEHFKAQKAETRDLLVRFGTAAFLSSQLMLYSTALYAGYFQGIEQNIRHLFEIISLILTMPVLFYSGMPFIKNTLIGLRRFHFTMDSLITLGSGSAFIYSVYEITVNGKVYFDTSAMIVTLILLGRYIESAAKGRASQSIEKLAELTPKDARVVRRYGEDKNSAGQTVPLSSVRKGDFVEVIPGERVPLDGIVLSGESEVDESLITGESKPVVKAAGSEVVGGSINLFGTFIFEVTRTGKETVLSGIIRSVEEAQAHKPKIQLIADRVVGYFVPAILVICLATMAGYYLNNFRIERALMAGISVLVIACPCSLGLATPLAVLVFTAMASSKGILIRNGEVIENAGRTTRLIFDKTGTLTVGKPVLQEVIILDNEQSREDIMSLAASVEALSEHSISRAIIHEANKDLLPVSGFAAVPGKGVEGTVAGKRIYVGNNAMMADNKISLTAAQAVDNIAVTYEQSAATVIYMAWENMVRAMFIVSDVIRDEAPGTADCLIKMGLDVSMISGDNRLTTNAVAAKTGVAHAIAEMTPEKKKDFVREAQKGGESVMMVGDGINDAPALTEALVGIAMGRGTDIAIESADAILVRNDLRLIPYFIGLSRTTYSIIRQNIFWAFFYNIVAVPMAISGVLHPIVAAGAMAASSLMVVLNSLRIKRAG